MRRWLLPFGLVLGLLAGCRSERARVLLPLPPEWLATAPARRLAPLAADSGVASVDKPLLPLPASSPEAPPAPRASASVQNKPPHWPLQKQAWQQPDKVAAAPAPPSSPQHRKEGVSDSLYFFGGTSLAILGVVVGLIIGGTTGLLVGALLYLPGALLGARGYMGKW